MSDIFDAAPTEALRYFTIKITTAAAPGVPAMGTGTGFCVAFKRGELTYPLVITNKHVIAGAGSVELWFHEQAADGTPMSGSGRKVSANLSQLPAISHPDPDVDLVALSVALFLDECPKQQGWKPFFLGIPPDLIPTDVQWAEFSSLEEVTMVGYPIGLADEQNNLPIVRRGVTATPLNVDYQAKREFLVDMAVFPGSSGSPIFLLNEGAFSAGGGIVMGSRFHLLGILYAGHQQLATGEIIARPAPVSVGDVPVIRQMVHLGLCIKSTRIRELIEIIGG